MGFLVTSEQKVRGLSKSNLYYTMRANFECSRESVVIDEKESKQYFVTYNQFIYADKVAYDAGEQAIHVNKHVKLVLTNDEYTSSCIPVVIYAKWKLQFPGEAVDV